MNRKQRRKLKKAIGDTHWFVGFREVSPDEMVALGHPRPAEGEKPLAVMVAGPVATENISAAVQVLFEDDGCHGVYQWHGEPDRAAIAQAIQTGAGIGSVKGAGMLIVPKAVAEEYARENGGGPIPNIGIMDSKEVQDLFNPNHRAN